MGVISLAQHSARGLATRALVVLLCHHTLANGFELAWHAPGECPQAEAVQETLNGLVHTEARGGPPELSVDIQRISPHEWSAVLTTEGATREVRGDSCASVSEAITVIVAMTIDRQVADAMGDDPTMETSEPTPKPSAPTPASEPPAAPPLPGATPAVPIRDQPAIESDFHTASDLGWGVSLRSLAEVGLLPGASLGGAGAARVGVVAHFAELAVSTLVPRDATLAEDPSMGGKFYWWAGELRGCSLLRVSWSACLGWEMGQLFGQGFGVRNPGHGSGLVLGPTTRLLWRWPVSRRLRVEASMAGFVTLLRPSFDLAGMGPVHRPSLISGRLELGIGWDP